ncbi:hypothetical protein BKA61DRAFT_658458 [Leptodontidium sp. MPI-SDFR-AT-0119]|nr:hypothetical protein BKA61DRAFT_658458 [Leptodontidium sp. MPI-SDFR-AT-0119]
MAPSRGQNEKRRSLVLVLLKALKILCALVYLEREKFEHGSLNRSNILLSSQGSIKIANQQCCKTVNGTGEPRDVRALGLITMELMQKYTKDDGAIDVDNLHRWPSDCDAVAFLSETISAASAHELQNGSGSKSRRAQRNRRAPGRAPGRADPNGGSVGLAE